MTRRVAVPQPVQDLHLLDDPDYVDAFAVRTTAQHSAAEWLTIMLGHAHPAILSVVRFAHGRVGKMRLKAADAHHPLGWDILDVSESRVVLGVEGGIVTPRVIAWSEPGQLVVTTMLNYETGGARAIWMLGRHVHRAVARYLLSTAARHG